MLMKKQDVYKIVTERSKGKCEYCGIRLGTQRHHILLRNKKIPESIENIIVLCKSCHNHSNTKLLKELKLRLQSYYFNLGHTEEETRKLMGGKLYLNQAGEIEKTLKAWWLE